MVSVTVKVVIIGASLAGLFAAAAVAAAGVQAMIIERDVLPDDTMAGCPVTMLRTSSR